MAKPLVGIVMGSDSDMSVMKAAAEMLARFGIEYEITILSAHRTPERAFQYARAAIERGIEVIISGAGGAAHLPGLLAALTPVPVIGVPIKTKTLNGMDSLLSIVQMPPGIPVATMAINGAQNAAIMAAQILGVKYAEIREKISRYRKSLEAEVLRKSDMLAVQGFEKYLSGMGSEDK